MRDELLKLLAELNSENLADFVDCLQDNMSQANKNRYLLLKHIYQNEKASWNTLTVGCRAAALIYLMSVEKEEA
jgi:hypothetical protein